MELLPGRHGLAVRRPALTGETVARVLARSHRELAQAESLAALCQSTATLVQARLGFAHAAVLRYEPSGAARTQAAAYGVKGPPPAELLHHPATALPITLRAAGLPHQLVMLADTESPSVELAPSATDPARAVELAGCLLHAPSADCVAHVQRARAAGRCWRCGSSSRTRRTLSRTASARRGDFFCAGIRGPRCRAPPPAPWPSRWLTCFRVSSGCCRGARTPGSPRRPRTPHRRCARRPQ